MMLKLQKTFTATKAVMDASGTLSGMASPIGRPDRAGDVPFPGFFTTALKGFLEHGFNPVGHNWDSLPAGYPTEAYEGQGPDGYGLYSVMAFHSIQTAQDARVVCGERLAAGKSVGLSVGMVVAGGDYQWFEDGVKLLAFAAANGHDMKLFDTKALTAWDRPCRGLFKCHELFEYSIVTVPVATAYATTVKGVSNDSGGPLYGLTLKDHLADLLFRLADGRSRVAAAREQRQADDPPRDLGPERKAQVMDLIEGLKALESEATATIAHLSAVTDEAGASKSAAAARQDRIRKSLEQRATYLVRN